MVQTASPLGTNAFGWEFNNAIRLSKKVGLSLELSMRTCTLKVPEINRKNRALHPGTGYLSSATLHLVPKKHYYGLTNQSINQYKLQTDRAVQPTGCDFHLYDPMKMTMMGPGPLGNCKLL